MRSRACILGCAAMLAGCDQAPAPADSGLAEVQAAAVSVRNLPPDAPERSRAFEILVREPGWLRVSFGPDGGSISFPVAEVPERRVLRVLSEELDGRTIVDRFLRPLFGPASAGQLLASSPDAADRKLLITTLRLESPEGEAISSLGPIGTAQPVPRGVSLTSTAFTGQVNSGGGPLRLSGWLYTTHDPGDARRKTMGISPQLVDLRLDGAAVDFEDVGAVFRELTLEFSEDEFGEAAAHPCAVANRLCPAD